MDNFARFLIIKSDEGEDQITNLSPFVIEKQIEAILGTPKSVKKTEKQNIISRNKQKNTNRKSIESKEIF